MKANVSEEQINALKYLILNLNGSDEAKKIVFALIDASERLTKPVAYTASTHELVGKVSSFIHSDKGINLRRIIKLLGVSFNTDSDRESSRNVTVNPNNVWHFSDHDGYFSEGEYKVAMRPGEEHTVTFWLSFHSYDHKAIEIFEEQVNEAELIAD